MKRILGLFLLAMLVLGLGSCANDSTIAEKLLAAPHFFCEVCGTKYKSQADALLCGEFYGCPKFDLSANKDKLAYKVMDMYYMVFDKDTKKVKDAWFKFEDYKELAEVDELRVFIPGESVLSKITPLFDPEAPDLNRISGNSEGDQEMYQKLKEIMDNQQNKEYQIGYFNLKTIFDGHEYTEDKDEMFSALGITGWDIPVEYRGHDNLYIYLSEGDFTICDFTEMKSCAFEFYEGSVEQLGVPTDLEITGIQDFPDTNAAVEVENTTGYKILQRKDTDDINHIAIVNTNTATDEEKNMDAEMSPIYKSGNKFYMNGYLGG